MFSWRPATSSLGSREREGGQKSKSRRWHGRQADRQPGPPLSLSLTCPGLPCPAARRLANGLFHAPCVYHGPTERTYVRPASRSLACVCVCDGACECVRPIVRSAASAPTALRGAAPRCAVGSRGGGGGNRQPALGEVYYHRRPNAMHWRPTD